MKEWVNPYNSLNSYKGLLYRDWYDKIINTKERLLPPVAVNIDPVNHCNFHCLWCNGKSIIDNQTKPTMKTGHFLKLIDMCRTWGVKAICYAGGGEPTLHPDLGLAFEHTINSKLEFALITNGSGLEEKLNLILAKSCRWTGISIDAATSTTFKKCKGTNNFDLVIDNIKNLTSLNPIGDVTYKFLIHPLNFTEILQATKLAKKIGCTGIHIRPYDTSSIENKHLFEKRNYTEITKQIDASFKECQSDTFNVFAIRHKYEPDMYRRIRFTKCRASSLMCMLEANGDVSICIDRKGLPSTKLCSHENPIELLTIWGTSKHRDLLNKINPVKDCSKCTMTIYQELVDAYEQDKFCWRFP